jgi:cobalamin synthase
MLLALLIFVSYTIIAINMRTIATAHYPLTITSSTLFMVVNFFLIQHVAEAKTWQELCWYIFGGVTGDVFGIYLSKRLEIWMAPKSTGG